MNEIVNELCGEALQVLQNLLIHGLLMVLQSVRIDIAEHRIIRVASALRDVQVLYAHGLEIGHTEVSQVVETVVRDIVLFQEPVEFVVDLFGSPRRHISLRSDRADQLLGHDDIPV